MSTIEGQGPSSSPLPSATGSLTTAVSLLATSELWAATAATIVIALVGLGSATLIGVLVGVAIGSSPIAMHITRIPMEFLKPIPPIVVLPIAVLVLGPTAEMGVFLAFFGCFIAIAIQTAAGVFDTDPVARATGQSYGMTRMQILTSIVFPSALPFIGTAVRVAAPAALVIAVVAGLLGGGPGLGRSIMLSQLSGQQEQLFAYVLILGFLGLIVQGTSQWLERKILHWHPQYRKEAS